MTTFPSITTPAPSPHLPRAACRNPGIDPLWFFPERGSPGDEAKAVCARCPELLPCREFALSDPQLVGIWGGLNGLERRRERRRRRLAECEDESMADAPIDFEDEPNDDELAAIESDEVAAPKCSWCNRPAKTGRPTCGSPECVALQTKERKRRNGNVRRPRSEQVKSNGNGNGLHANGTADPFAMFAALRTIGVNVVRLELEVAGEHWSLSRQGGR